MPLQAAIEEMGAAGWHGIEARAYTGATWRSDYDIYVSEPPRKVKEWVVTLFSIVKPGFTTVKIIGKGKTLEEAIQKAKEEAYVYNSRGRAKVYLPSPKGDQAQS